jgi:alpha-galactosidase
MTFLRAALATLLVVAANACSDGTPSTAPTQDDVPTPEFALAGGTGSLAQLKSRLFSDMCVDVPASAYSNGTQVITYSCHTGANQVFLWKSTGEIVPWKSQAMCIDAYSALGRDGDPIGVWSCNGGSNQRWTATTAGEIKGINGKCIGPVSTARANGTKLTLQPCNGSTSQKWDKGGASTPPTT